ncbi:MAG: hypothetical protein HY785_13225 [Oscillatoriophycideae cyanobacterium NC_groundwater_1537_Pr4_S-0.65um_50_18]|nr:hypothetical protein [Oscillatoriophycideae cyanobacterium NC_groundwater_1537_Pr4_S-0.65um_50_18]
MRTPRLPIAPLKTLEILETLDTSETLEAHKAEAHKTEAHKTETDKASSYKAIAFQIDDYWFALPPAAVLRVAHQAALIQNMGSNRLIYWGNQPLPVLNLRPVLAAIKGDRATANLDPLEEIREKPFCVIAASGKALTAIPVDRPPVLVELPIAATHPIPVAHRKAMNGIASHIAIASPFGTVFLLNLSNI